MSEPSPSQGLKELSDEELWERFVAGRDAAIEVLVSRYRDELCWYLLLSMGRQDAAATCLRDVWALLAAYRRPFDGFGSFKSWLYAAVTQHCVPATHPDVLGLTILLDDLGRVGRRSRRARLFYSITDMKRSIRQPFLLVTVAGLSPAEAARACNFTIERTWRSVEMAYRRLARTGLFNRERAADEV